MKLMKFMTGTVVAKLKTFLISPTGLISASAQGYHSDTGPGKGVRSYKDFACVAMKVFVCIL